MIPVTRRIPELVSHLRSKRTGYYRRYHIRFLSVHSQIQCLPLPMRISVKRREFGRKCEYSQIKEETEIVIKLINTGMRRHLFQYLVAKVPRKSTISVFRVKHF
jgi:hypothetical protein